MLNQFKQTFLDSLRVSKVLKSKIVEGPVKIQGACRSDQHSIAFYGQVEQFLLILLL